MCKAWKKNSASLTKLRHWTIRRDEQTVREQIDGM